MSCFLETKLKTKLHVIMLSGGKKLHQCLESFLKRGQENFQVQLIFYMHFKIT